MTLDGDTVFAVTGAAGGIVSAITADLAGASGGVFHLLDVVPEPDAAPLVYWNRGYRHLHVHEED